VRGRRAVIAGLAIAAIAATLAYARFDAWRNAPLAVGSESVTVEIARGEPLAAVAQDLAGRGVLSHPRWFVAYARVLGADSRIRAGEYAIQSGATPATLLQQFERGAVIQRSVTLVEGWTFRDLRRALERADSLRNTLKGKSDAEVMSELGEAGTAPEGLFFPDTYLFSKGTTDREILGRARDRMRRELESAWQARAPGLPLQSAYEALILASIVERETANAEERPRIAGVFVGRLRAGMRLQTDPTVIFGLGNAYDGNLRRADLERDGPYNTYTRAGLPPTPISMPGAASLRAAVRPDDRGELYFVATGLPDGTHRFSRTLAEHEAAVKQYLVRYRQQQRK
jgi:UPF0755 protein